MGGLLAMPGSYNLPPSQPAVIMVLDLGDGLQLQRLAWGLPP